MDPTCTPAGGVKAPEPEPAPQPQPEQPVTPVTEPVTDVKEEGGNNMVMIIGICVGIVAVLIIVFIFLCIRKRRK